MSINLNNVNVSLDKFNDAARGQFNIGQIKLSSDGTSVYRANSRKTLTIFNKTKIRPEESLAIKNAFCAALKREGLSANEVESIRKRLGISGSILDMLKAGDIKPLSAAEVREIIDEYAGKINQARASKPGAAQLETSAEIYRGVSEKTLASRKTTRDAINATSTARMKTKVGGTVNQMLDILQASGPSNDITINTKAIAIEMLKTLRSPNELASTGSSYALKVAPITLMRSNGGAIVAKFELDNGNVFSVSTNLSKEELVNQLQKVLSLEDIAKIDKSLKAQAAGKPAVKLSPGQVIADLKRVFNIVKDPVEMDKRRTAILSILPKGIQGKQFSKEELALHATKKLREDITDSIVNELVPALRKARGMDVRNTELINQVREVIAGNANIDADELVGNIADALNEKEVILGQGDGVMGQVDDLEKSLNINDLLGNK